MEVMLVVALGAAVAGFVQGLSGFAFGMVAMSFWAWVLEPQLAAVLCGQTDRLYTTYAGGTALCRARIDVTVQDTTVQLHLRDTAFEVLTQTGQDLQALFCTELQQAFAALTTERSADFFHLQFWHANLYGPRSPAPAPQLTILWE